VIIGYADFKPLESLIPLTIHNDLRDAIKLLEEKIKARKEYLGIIENLSKVDKPDENIYNEKNFQQGICKEQEYPKITRRIYECKGDGKSFKRIRLKCEQHFENIVVG
jgi:hypothetical protein